MKGISLPINAIVIIAVSVLVLVVIAAIFTGGSTGLSDPKAWTDGCSKARLQGCSKDLFAWGADRIIIEGYTPYGEGNEGIDVACSRALGLGFSPSNIPEGDEIDQFKNRCWSSCCGQAR